MSLTTGDDKTSKNAEEQPRGDNNKSERGRDDRSRRDDNNEDRETSGPGMRNIGRSLGRALSRNNAGEALSKAFNAFDKLFHDEHAAASHQGDNVVLDQYKLLMFDQVENRVDMSAVLFTYMMSNNGKDHVFYYTMLVEGSTPSLPPVRYDDRGRSFEIPRVAGDVLNARYSDRVYAQVEAVYGTAASYHDCGTNVLPSIIDVDDVKNGNVIRNLAFYVNAAIETISVELLGYQPAFTLNWLERDDSLEVELDWTGVPQYSAVGEPRRTDVKVTITSNVRERGADGDNCYRDHLSRVGGSFELVYSPAASSGSAFGARRNQEETQLFTPLFTITDLDTDYKAITLEMQILGMASTATLSDDLLWVNNFRTTQTKSKDNRDIDYKDIGALNYLAPQGTYFDIKSANLDTEGFLEYFGTLCRPDLAYAMDVEERGENTWINGVFMEAAQGSEASLKRIFDAADNLTDGHFSSHYRQMSDDRGLHNPFEDSQNRILLGWYNENGEKHDLRNIDLLYWLNRRGDQEPKLALEWQDTFDQIKDSIELRIERRIAILADVFGETNFKVTGYAQQVYIDSMFIAACAAGVKACDVRIDQGNTKNTYGDNRPRGNYTISRMAGSNLGGGLFARNSRRDDRDGGGRSGRTYTGRGR
jgi:hypothetical protein